LSNTQSTFAEAFLGFGVEQRVGFAEDVGDFRGERIAGDSCAHGRLIKVAGHFAGEPVAAIAAEQIVPHLAPGHDVERLGVRPEAEDFEDVDPPGDLVELGDIVGPVCAPVPAVHAFQFRAQPGFDGRDGGRDAVVKIEGANVLVEIRRARDPAAQRVHL